MDQTTTMTTGSVQFGPAVPVQPAAPAPPVKRAAILGTAPSWVQCPWEDTTLCIAGLNDGYVLGYKRADIWFDLHPFGHMLFYDRQHPPQSHEIPAGMYLRPKGHLEWLSQQQIPVMLQAARPEWPHARPFPRDEVLAFWERFWPWRVDRKGDVSAGKDYEVSSPSWMYMWFVMQGFTEIHIYGVHLATEWEYVRQRPNLEFLMGVAAGLGVKNVLPTSAPICQSSFRYGYDQKPEVGIERVQRHIDALTLAVREVNQELEKTGWHQRGRREHLQARKARLKLELEDARLSLQQVKMQIQVA